MAVCKSISAPEVYCRYAGTGTSTRTFSATLTVMHSFIINPEIYMQYTKVNDLVKMLMKTLFKLCMQSVYAD